MSNKLGKTRSVSGPKVGEIIGIESLLGPGYSGVFRVENVSGDMLGLSAGEIFLGVSLAMAKVVKRHLPEPASWLEREIDLLRAQLAMCECKDCRDELRKKEAILKAQTTGQSGEGVATLIH